MKFKKIELENSKWKKQYSICTLVSNFDQYDKMYESFVNAGFSDEDTEYIVADNSVKNNFDAFTAYNQFLNSACGKHIILCHQDILLDFDNRNVLETRLSQLDEIDPLWAVVGNAGSSSFGRNTIRITDPSIENLRFGSFPSRVFSLDENFILVKNSANLSVSHDLRGFHLYGTDLCMIADILGCTSYVIDFHLRHLSSGTVDEVFHNLKNDLVRKYQRALRPRLMQTMIDRFYLSGSKIACKTLNHRGLLTLIKSIVKRFN